MARLFPALASNRRYACVVIHRALYNACIGVFCAATEAGMRPHDAIDKLLMDPESVSIGVMAQVFTVVHEEYVTREASHEYRIISNASGYFGSEWNMTTRWYDKVATDVAVYQERRLPPPSPPLPPCILRPLPTPLWP